MKTPNLIEKAFFLKKTPLFSGLDLDALLAIADKASVSLFQAGDPVFTFGQGGATLYVIVHGKVQVLEAGGATLGVLTVGSYFGDESVFGLGIRGYGASCLSRAMLLSVARTHLHSIVSEYPSVAFRLLEQYATAVSPADRYPIREEV